MSTRKVRKFGTILVNSKGFTLYMFVPDKQKKVTCKGGCAVVWPPLKLKKGQKPTAGGAAKKKLLGMDGTVVTYNRWPLYTYVVDTKPGQARVRRSSRAAASGTCSRRPARSSRRSSRDGRGRAEAAGRGAGVRGDDDAEPLAELRSPELQRLSVAPRTGLQSRPRRLHASQRNV